MQKPPQHLVFAGDVVRWRSVGGLVLAEVAYEPGQRIHARHAHARFVLVLKGSLTEGGDSTAPAHGPSTLLFQCANQSHAYSASARGAVCLEIDMDPSWIARVEAQAPLPGRSAAFRRGLLLHLAQRLYGEFRLRDDVSRLVIESLTLGLVAQASRRLRQVRRPAPLWLQAALEFIELHFTDRLSLASVASQVGVHPVHLARTFSSVHQTSFASYIRQLRIEFAMRQLAGPSALSDIAFAAGFCDQSHFSRSFKEHTGLTPGAYRATLR
jgi:AraC family transcriptional regulator